MRLLGPILVLAALPEDRMLADLNVARRLNFLPCDRFVDLLVAEIKADVRFKEFGLVKQSRLSVMGVAGAMATALMDLLNE